jgi:isopentenyl-diphosphate delta-isomerase type 1
MSSRLILVNEQDQVIGEAEKLEVHQRGLLHRAFSVLLYRQVAGKLEFLLQQRHPSKYHSGGLWTNTCCSHPRPGEETLDAARRRLHEETGIDLLLQEIGVFRYIAYFANGLIEHEIDHVCIAEYHDLPQHFDRQEIQAMEWIESSRLKRALDETPYRYTPWFGRVLSEFDAWFSQALHKKP